MGNQRINAIDNQGYSKQKVKIDGTQYLTLKDIVLAIVAANTYIIINMRLHLYPFL